MNLVNDQVRISGEILATEVSDSNTSGSLSLSTTYASVDNLTAEFTSDRSGFVEVEVQLYFDKSSSGSVESIFLRLLDASDNTISGTEREVGNFHSSDGSQIVRFSWFLEVTSGTSYEYKLQAKQNGGTFTVRWGGTYPAVVMKVIGL